VVDTSAWSRAHHPEIRALSTDALLADRLRLSAPARLEILLTARDGKTCDELAEELSAVRTAPLTTCVVRAAEEGMRALAHRSAGTHRIHLACASRIARVARKLCSRPPRSPPGLPATSRSEPTIRFPCSSGARPSHQGHAATAQSIPSGAIAILPMMGEVSDHRREADYETFVLEWLAPLVAVLLRAVRDPALAYDLATETLAAAHLRWESAPSGDAGVGWVLRLGAQVLDTAVQRGRVPSTERRRGQQPRPRRLTLAEQQEITALAEHHIELPAAARDAADALARMAPPPHALAQLRRSDLVEVEPLPEPRTIVDPEPRHHGGHNDA
jgi:predicted nucleic acid-binding protein